MNIKVLAPESLPTGWTRAAWRYSCMAMAPGRVALLASDAQWSIRYAAWERNGDLAALLPLCRPKVAVMRDEHYDLRTVFPESGPVLPEDPRRWLLLGGSRDLGAGLLVREEIPADEAAELSTLLVRFGFALAAEEGLAGAALYLRDSEVEVFAAGAGAAIERVPMGQSAVIDVDFSTMDGYLSSLPRLRRNKIRRDWRDFREAGLRTVERSVEEAIDQASELVVKVKQRHGIPDHPRLAAYRLQRWARAGVGDYRAFLVQDEQDNLIAACFAANDGKTVESYEMGLADVPGLRHLAYLEAGYYAPLRWAMATGCTRLELGIDSSAPKSYRGARLTPVWAVRPAA